MSEVDFTYVVTSLPNCSKLHSCIIQYEQIMKNVKRISLFLIETASKIIILIYKDL
jgi:hypothetical protein